MENRSALSTRLQQPILPTTYAIDCTRYAGYDLSCEMAVFRLLETEWLSFELLES